MKTMKHVTVLLIAGVFFACTTPAVKKSLTGVSGKKQNKSLTYGIDISKYQGDETDFLTRKKDSLSFILCKATEGIDDTDPDFVTNWTTIAQKGFIRGAYHFYHCEDDPILQATHFLTVVSEFASTDIPPIVDFEEAGVNASCTKSKVQTDLLTFLAQVAEQTGRKPIIYTDNNMGNLYLNDQRFSGYTLFIADYEMKSAPTQPSIWKNQPWTFWQKSDHYTVNSTTNDFDLFNGSLRTLKTFIQNH